MTSTVRKSVLERIRLALVRYKNEHKNIPDSHEKARAFVASLRSVGVLPAFVASEASIKYTYKFCKWFVNKDGKNSHYKEGDKLIAWLEQLSTTPAPKQLTIQAQLHIAGPDTRKMITIESNFTMVDVQLAVQEQMPARGVSKLTWCGKQFKLRDRWSDVTKEKPFTDKDYLEVHQFGEDNA